MPDKSDVKCYVQKSIFVEGKFKGVGEEITLSNNLYRELASVGKVGMSKPGKAQAAEKSKKGD